jgi:hypothetical protein
LRQVRPSAHDDAVAGGRVYQHIVISSQARSALSDAAAVRSKSLRAAHSVLVVLHKAGDLGMPDGEKAPGVVGILLDDMVAKLKDIHGCPSVVGVTCLPAADSGC